MPRITRRAPEPTPAPQEDAPRGRMSRRPPSEQDVTPAGRGRRSAPTADAPAPARRRAARGSQDYGPRGQADDTAEDEYYEDGNDGAYADDAPRVTASEAKVGGAGWGAAEKYRDETRGSGVNRIKIDEGETVVGLFMDDAPFNSYTQRWVESAGRSFVGLKDNDPLEALGLKAKAYSAFNFVPLGSTVDKHDQKYEELSVWVLQASPALVQQLEPDEAERGSKAAPLNAPGRFYEIRYFKKANGWGDYEITPLSEAQLAEFWQMDAPTEAELEELNDQCLTADDFPSLPTRAEVEAAAAKIANADRPGVRRGR